MTASIAHVTKQLERAGFTISRNGREYEARKANRARAELVTFCEERGRVDYLNVRNERDCPDSQTDYYPGIWSPNVAQAIRSADASLAYALQELVRHEAQRCGIERGYPCPRCAGGTMEPCGCPHDDHWTGRGHLYGHPRPPVALEIGSRNAICLFCAEHHAKTTTPIEAMRYRASA